MPNRYPIADSLQKTCDFLQLDPVRVLRRAGLPGDWLTQAKSELEGDAYFRLWDALLEEAGDPETVFRLAYGYAHGPFVPPVLAFSCAETVYVGLQRLSAFKPIIAPMEMRVSRDDTGARIEMVSTVPGRELPTSLEEFELTYLLECARTFTGRDIVPLAIETRAASAQLNKRLDFFRIEATEANRTCLAFRPEDADLPLITRSATLWETVEPGLTRQLEEREDGNAMTIRVRKLLTESLPGGCTTADEAARRLNVSKRSLQRRLTEESTSFHAILNDVRAEISERYLTESDLSVPEISHLLGFRDTSSFFRAFQGWTGTTPGNFRANAGHTLH